MGFINVLGILTEGFYSLTSGIYYFLGNLYTFIVDLATTNFINSSVIEDFVRTIYVLAGVFMLFRVAVSFLNSLIDPDKFTDKNEGASKILTRLVIVVVLMIGLAPGSFVYRFLDRLQSAVVGEDGLIVNIVGKAELNVGSAVNKYISDINPFGDMSVDAANFKNLKVGSIVQNGSGVCYELTAYGTAKSNPSYKKVSDCTDEYYVILNKYCKQTTKFVTSGEEGIRYPADLKNVATGKEIRNVYVNYDICEGKQVDDGFKNSGAITDIDDGSNKGSKKVTLDSGGLFAQSVLNTMTSCPNVDDQASKECTKDIKGNVLVDNDKAISDIDDEKLSVSWLIAIIIGIVVIIYLAVLCIEVVVRSLKLMLLQMISPIAIISYVSPKDKILGQWVKMYVSTYLDLFIKLFAIKLGAELIASIKFSGSVIKDLILILGCLVFMKVIPTVISKIFGIDIASGTLKDSTKMLKTALGMGALATGGIIARGVAAATNAKGNGLGFGANAFNVLKSAVAGGASGLMAGYKGTKFGEYHNFFAGQAGEGVKNADMEAERSEEYENYRLEAQQRGEEPMSRGRWVRKNNRARRLRQYLGIPGEAQQLAIEKKQLEKEKSIVGKEKDYFEGAESAFSSALGAGADKVAEGETDSLEAKKYREYEKIFSNISGMTQQEFESLSSSQKQTYYRVAGYTDAYASEVNGIKTSIESKINSGQALVYPDGTISGLSDVEKQFVSLKNVNGQVNIDVNTDAILEGTLSAHGVSYAKLQNDISDATKKQKKVGEMDHLITEILKGTEDDDNGTENGVKSAYQYLVNKLNLGIKEMDSFQYDSSLPDDVKVDARERSQQLQEKLNALKQIEDIGNGKSEIPPQYASREEYVADLRDQLKTLFKGGLKGQISKIKANVDNVDAEVRDIDARLESIKRQQEVNGGGDNKK